MLRKEVGIGRIKGILVCRRAPQISHLLFEDNSIIFCRSTMEEGNRGIKVFKDYEEAFGQKLNKEKTFLFFSKNTKRDTQEGIKDLFGAQIILQHEKYLGLPLMVGRGRKQVFSQIEDQMGRKVAVWK